MKNLVFKFELPISNNKENTNFDPAPSPHWPKMFLINMEKLVTVFDGLISNNKESKKIASHPCTPLT